MRGTARRWSRGDEGVVAALDDDGADGDCGADADRGGSGDGVGAPPRVELVIRGERLAGRGLHDRDVVVVLPETAPDVRPGNLVAALATTSLDGPSPRPSPCRRARGLGRARPARVMLLRVVVAVLGADPATGAGVLLPAPACPDAPRKPIVYTEHCLILGRVARSEVRTLPAARDAVEAPDVPASRLTTALARRVLPRGA